MKKILLAVILSCSMLIFMDSCKKDKNKTTCSSTLYGYTGTWGVFGSYSPCSFGTINPATHTLGSITTFSGTPYSTHATFNTSDHCYYFFIGSSGLCKMTISGTLTTYSTTSGTAVRYDGIIYSSTTNKLYAIKVSTGATAIVELVVSGTTFSDVVLAPAIGIEYWASPASTAINNATGTIYYSLRDVATNIYSIEKYTIGTSAASVIASGTNSGILGLQFNRNNNMLYAVREGSAPQEFIKIDPSSGSVTSLGALGFGVNNEFYSSVIDACSDHYILTSMIDSASSTFSQISMTGTVLQHDTATNIYQGLEVLY